jgi:hypothetical protein
MVSDKPGVRLALLRECIRLAIKYPSTRHPNALRAYQAAYDTAAATGAVPLADALSRMRTSMAAVDAGVSMARDRGSYSHTHVEAARLIGEMVVEATCTENAANAASVDVASLPSHIEFMLEFADEAGLMMSTSYLVIMHTVAVSAEHHVRDQLLNVIIDDL